MYEAIEVADNVVISSQKCKQREDIMTTIADNDWLKLLGILLCTLHTV